MTDVTPSKSEQLKIASAYRDYYIIIGNRRMIAHYTELITALQS